MGEKGGGERRRRRGGEGEEGRGGEEEMGRDQTIVNEGRHASRELGGICNDLSSRTVSLHRLPAIIQVLIYENKIKRKKNKLIILSPSLSSPLHPTLFIFLSPLLLFSSPISFSHHNQTYHISVSNFFQSKLYNGCS